MTCYYGKPAWIERDKQGNPIRNENGKVNLKFTAKGSQLDPDYEIPCGKCLGCRASQSRDWGVRMFHETQMHERNCMITLTYDDDHLPEDGKISVHHAQKFLKRMRKHGHKLRYVLAGEYGEQTKRPHYHIAYFGDDFLTGAVHLNKKLYYNDQLTEIWGQGHVTINPLEVGSCMYIAGYVQKKVGDADTFALQSRRPPIGKDWVIKNRHLLGNRQTFNIFGNEFPIPRKYFEWIVELDYQSGLKKPVRLDIPTARNREINHTGRRNLREHNL